MIAICMLKIKSLYAKVCMLKINMLRVTDSEKDNSLKT